MRNMNNGLWRLRSRAQGWAAMPIELLKGSSRFQLDHAQSFWSEHKKGMQGSKRKRSPSIGLDSTKSKHSDQKGTIQTSASAAERPEYRSLSTSVVRSLQIKEK